MKENKVLPALVFLNIISYLCSVGSYRKEDK